MTLEAFVDKAAYSIRMMRLARWMSKHLADDYERRVVGRMVLVYVPIYAEAAFSLLKKPGLSTADRVRLRDGVRQLRDDFEAFHDRIRHDLAAHRDALPLDVAIEAWNEIDSDTLAWFCGAAEESLGDIVASHPRIAGAIEDFNALSDDDLANELNTPIERSDAIRFSTDSLAMTRGHAGIIPIHEVQASAQVLISIGQSLDACVRIHQIVHRDIGCHLLLKTMFVIDTINLVDGIYGEPVGASSRRSTSFLSILEEGNFGGAGLLRQSLDQLDLEAVEAVRGVRNKACAHLDPALGLRQLQKLIFDLEDPLVLDRVLNPAWLALQEACAQDMTTRWLLMNKASLSGLRLASSPGVRAFDRDISND